MKDIIVPGMVGITLINFGVSLLLVLPVMLVLSLYLDERIA